MSDKKRQTVIEEGTEFDGKISSDCGILLSGMLQGELNAPSLKVTPSGMVQGKIKVTDLHSEGEISGEIDAHTVELSGQVNDKTVIRAKSLEVKLTKSGGGVEVSFGNCELAVGDKPAEIKDEDEMPEKQAAPVDEHYEEEPVAEMVTEENVVDTVSDLLK
jgi:cytoskeletal protein CcmA (bactofilin family)